MILKLSSGRFAWRVMYNARGRECQRQNLHIDYFHRISVVYCAPSEDAAPHRGRHVADDKCDAHRILIQEC